MKELICEIQIPPIPPIEMMIVSVVDLKGELIIIEVRRGRTCDKTASPFRGIGGSSKSTTNCNKLEPEFAPVADLRRLYGSSPIAARQQARDFQTSLKKHAIRVRKTNKSGLNVNTGAVFGQYQSAGFVTNLPGFNIPPGIVYQWFNA